MLFEMGNIQRHVQKFKSPSGALDLDSISYGLLRSVNVANRSQKRKYINIEQFKIYIYIYLIKKISSTIKI